MTPQWALVLFVLFTVVRLLSRWILGGGSSPSASEPQTHGGMPTTYPFSFSISVPFPYSAVLRQMSSPVSAFHSLAAAASTSNTY